MHPVGNTIPYSFYDIQSFADLYYAAHSNKLLAVTFFYSSETEKVKTTQVKIWSIDFPPEHAEPVILAKVDKGTNLWWLLALVPLGIALLIWRRRAKSKVVIAPLPTVEEVPAPDTRSRSMINLFGQFQVIDKEGADSTKFFTPLLKELFLLILVYTVRNNKGISSEALNDILWHDKPVKDAKNNRSVNLAKLKTILEKVGHVVINKDTGSWQVHNEDESVWIDYRVFVQLLQEPAQSGKPYMQRLLPIVERGPFLQQTEYSWLDDIKAEVSNQVLDRCLRYIQAHQSTEDPEFIIEICNAIFSFDRLNEDALTYKCKSLITLKRHAIANTTYLSFTKEYKEIYGEDFRPSFNEIIK
jgi:two-component SAPR family response regulator